MSFVIKTTFGIVLLCAGSAYAQAKPTGPSPEMNVCSVALTIGMTKAAVVDKVAQTCDLIKVPVEADSWLLKEKSQNGKGVGMVEFDSGRVSDVHRSWVPTEGRYEPSDLARSLITAVASALQGRSAATGTISYAIDHEPDMNLYQLRLALPDHREIRVIVIENPAKPVGERVIMLDVQEHIVK